MAIVNEVRKTGIGNSGVSIVIDYVDNQVLVALNGVQLAEITGPGSQIYSENITGRLEDGRPNILTITLTNFFFNGTNPVGISGRVNVGSEEINLGQSSGNAAQGIFSQTMIILEK